MGVYSSWAMCFEWQWRGDIVYLWVLLGSTPNSAWLSPRTELWAFLDILYLWLWVYGWVFLKCTPHLTIKILQFKSLLVDSHRCLSITKVQTRRFQLWRPKQTNCNCISLLKDVRLIWHQLVYWRKGETKTKSCRVGWRNFVEHSVAYKESLLEMEMSQTVKLMTQPGAALIHTACSFYFT